MYKEAIADGTSFYDFMKALSKVFPKEMGELTASQYRRTTGLKNETLTLALKETNGNDFKTLINN